MDLHGIQQFFDGPWMTVIKSAIATASLIAAVTPNKSDNLVIQILRDFIDAVALNVHNAAPGGKGGK